MGIERGRIRGKERLRSAGPYYLAVARGIVLLWRGTFVCLVSRDRRGRIELRCPGGRVVCLGCSSGRVSRGWVGLRGAKGGMVESSTLGVSLWSANRPLVFLTVHGSGISFFCSNEERSEIVGSGKVE